ncbi:hypothetical protein FRZ67_19195 [Panacibacter ginsenosidivorans]|uniref:Uncharacterized protein n=1 Tax=Panacibacter ginsenosidivorans TaxID=1813871 RepID=A0A5B8VCX6_9BACT|nr:hypothetical protein [Panacibacter ginsenosidivorans]QEC69330.1 hypothetical protein FRZ67_19195 [Panacibacter ginsenosidivorans]
MSIFNCSMLAEAALAIQSFFDTVIGHKEDVSLMQKTGGKDFITPIALQDKVRNLQQLIQQNKSMFILVTYSTVLIAVYRSESFGNSPYFSGSSIALFNEVDK